MKAQYFGLSLFTLLSACGGIMPDAGYRPSTAVSKKLNENVPEGPRQQDCRAQISKAVCLVDPSDWSSRDARPCFAGSEAFAPQFREIYDHYPAAVQKMFCSIGKIYIENESFSTAQAWLTRDATGKVKGASLSIRRTIVDAHLPLDGWATWKDQLSFGGDPLTYEPKYLYPRVRVRSSASSTGNDTLFFVIAHEIAHMFDQMGNVNQLSNCQNQPDHDQQVCEFSPQSWGAFSWKNSVSPLPQWEFSRRSQLCFYLCDGNYIPTGDVDDLYQELATSNFVSLYGATNPWDDFAEHFAYVLLHQGLHADYKIELAEGVSFDVMARLNSSVLAEKQHFISSFLKRTDLKYPGK